ncbi:MAG TPA: Uma2 family endonuclease [Blastocatellia bacterium]|jgi:Uma2 family endonuclease|nr:Uma2 family endonuclease [Blastocatellia bacterium]
MSTQALSYYEIVSQLPADAVVTFHDVGWDEYEDLLEQVGEAEHLRITYDSGALQVMTLSPEHEKYARFLEGLMTAIRLRLHINILSFGSATVRKRGQRKGNEPDACFYVQNAYRIGNRLQLDFASDPPPDIAVEVDVHHDSRNKLDIYAALAVPEVWRFDGDALTIYLLEQDRYNESASSLALPMLTSPLLTDALTQVRTEGELRALMAFDEWLQGLKKP